MNDKTTPLDFRTSSFSGSNGNCVKVALNAARDKNGLVVVGDSKDPEGGHLRFTRPEWDAFIKGAKAGEFDLPTQ